MNTRFSFRFLVLIALSLSTVSAHAARMSELELAKYFDSVRPRSDVELMQVKSADGRVMKVTSPRADAQSLLKTRPAALRKEASEMRLKIESQCSSRRAPYAQFAIDFVPESLKFYTAIGLSAGEQMKEDPAYAQHFIQNSFLDPFGYASFAGFMFGSRSAASLLAMAEATYDPCTLVKKYHGPAPLHEASRRQRLFAPLAGQMTMVAGMTLSTMIDALRDPHIVTCAALAIGKVPEKDRASAEQSCDLAYEDWVMNGGKLRDMMPDFVSMTTVGLGLASPQIAAIASAEGYQFLGRATQKQLLGVAGGLTLRLAVHQAENTILYKGATLVMGVGKMAQLPVVRVAFEVGSMWAFFKLNDKLKPLLEKPWQTYWQNHDIEKTRTQVGNYLEANRKMNWDAKAVQAARRCYSDMGHGNVSITRCNDESDKPAQAIALLGRQEKKWRDFLIADAMAALSNWQNYVLQFSNVYTAANKVYEPLLKSIDEHRKDPSYVDPFYMKAPFNGTQFDLNAASQGLCSLPAKDLKKVTDAIALLEGEMKQEARPSVVLPRFTVQSSSINVKGLTLPTLSPKITNDPRFVIGSAHYDVNTLKSIADGLRAMDCKQTPKLTDVQRYESYTKATETLYWTLAQSTHPSYGLTIDNPDFLKRAKNNVYMQVYYKLDGPEPHWEGGAFVRAFNTNSDYINQDYKDLKPDHLGRAKTLQMSDYLLASMVCGPEATPTQAQKLAAANADRMSWMGRMRAVLSGTLTAPTPYTEKDMIQVEQYYAKHVAQDPSWSNLGGLLKSPISLTNTVTMWKADFRPPRVIRDLGFDPCGGDRKFISKYVAKADGTRSENTMDPYFTEWTINKKTYRGMQSLLQEFARTDLTNTSQFANWWSNNVESHVQKVIDVYRTEFVDLMNKKYVPVLTESARAGNGRPLGLINSLLDSANGTFDMLIPTVNIGANGAQAQAQMTSLRKQFIMRIRVMMMLIGPTQTIRQGMQSTLDGRMPEMRRNGGPAVPYLSGKGFNEAQIPTYIGHGDAFDSVDAAYRFNAQQVALLMNKMAKIASDKSKQLAPGPRANLQGIMKALFENLTGVVTEIDSLHGVTVAIRAPDLSASARK